MISEGHPQSDKFSSAIKELWELWNELQMKLFERSAILEDNLVAQQYLFDASEAEAWMAEQELYLMSPEKAKVTFSCIIDYIPINPTNSVYSSITVLIIKMFNLIVKCIFYDSYDVITGTCYITLTFSAVFVNNKFQ